MSDQPPRLPRLITTAQAAHRLRCTPRQLYSYIDSGALAPVRRGRQVWLRLGDVDNLCAALGIEPGPLGRGPRRRWPKTLPDEVAERDEPPLPDNAVLVRAGQFRVRHVRARAIECQRRMGFPGVSVAVTPGGDLNALAAMSPRLLEYDECATTTALEVRRDFGLAPTGRHPHFSIVLPDTSPATLRAVRAIFRTGISVADMLDDR